MAQEQNPTDAELDLLKVLWEHGPCTIAQALAVRPVSPEELAKIRLMPDEMEAKLT